MILISRLKRLLRKVVPESVYAKLRNLWLYDQDSQPIPTSVLFCTTNGVGLGHLTRALAVAKALRRIDPTRQIVFLVTTPRLSIVQDEDFFVYYVPYFGQYLNDKQRAEWNYLVRDTMNNISAIHNVELFVFDGFIPFAGLMESLRSRRNIRRAWIRRGIEKPERSALADERGKTLRDYYQAFRGGSQSARDRRTFGRCCSDSKR